MFKKSIAVALLFMLYCSLPTAYAQHVSCGFEFTRHQDADYIQKEKQLNQLIYNKTINTTTSTRANRTILYIPTVFHIIHQGGTENIADSVVVASINQLNLRFQNLAPYTDATGHAVDIQFCLASIDPQGNPTNGITRTFSTFSYLNASNDVDMKNLNRWDPLYYYNIWVVHSIFGFSISVSGYSSLPSNIGTPSDGVVIDFYSVNNYVLAHESGHYLGLYHTWQDGCRNDNCLLDGDNVCDTPPDTTTSGCMGNSCSSEMNDTSGFNPFIGDVNDLPNYMDYTSCPLSFSLGQADRMNYSLTAIRSLLLQSNGCGFTGGPAPVAHIDYTISPCNDGVVHFSDSLCTNITTVNWDFNNDGVYDSYIHNPVYTFPATGTYTVKLIVAGPGGVNTVYQTIFVQKGSTPFYPIIFNGGVFQNIHGQWASCGNFTNNFTAPAHAQSYLWSTGDTTQTISFTPTTTYTLTLTVVDSMGLTWTNALCHPLTVLVHPLPPAPVIYTNDPLTVCDGDLVTFHSTLDTTGGYTYTWYENGGGGTSNHDSTFTAVGYFPGIQYQLIVADTNYCYNYSNLLYVYSYNAPAMQSLTQNGLVLTSGWGNGNQWYRDGVAIPGATGMTYTVTQNGCYQDSWFFSFAPNCVTFSDSICFVSVGVNENNEENTISIFPVPANDYINITSSLAMYGSEYRITDPAGRLVLSGKIKAETTNTTISELAKGIYFVEVLSNEKKKKVFKMVKE